MSRKILSDKDRVKRYYPNSYCWKNLDNTFVIVNYFSAFPAIGDFEWVVNSISDIKSTEEAAWTDASKKLC